LWNIVHKNRLRRDNAIRDKRDNLQHLQLKSVVKYRNDEK